MHRLRGKVVAVTGAASGIGQGIAIAAAREGAAVALLDLDPKGIKETVARAGKGARTLSVPVDLADEKGVAKAFAALKKGLGPVDGLVSSAAIAIPKKLHESSVADWQRIFSVNLFGLAMCAKEAIRQMLAAKRGGSIVNIASIQGVLGYPDWAAYAASKGGVLGLTRQAAADYARKGIRVNALSPATVDTPMTRKAIADVPNPEETRRIWSAMHPLGRIGAPEDVAGAAVFLLSDESSWITGQNFVLDAGVSTTGVVGEW